MTTAAPSRRRRLAARPAVRADIEGLRAVAVLLVVADHLLGAPRGGFVGVDVFFVISGFLITGLLVREAEKRGRVSIEDFYGRRARRILPIALLVLLVTNVAARYVFVGQRVRDVLHDTGWSLAFLANKHFSDLGTDYFAQGRPASPLQHFWSLAVEEQFYLVWPLVVLLLARSLRRRGRILRPTLGAVLVVVLALSFAWNLHLTGASPTAAYFSTTGRAWELGLGALLAVLGNSLSRIPSLARQLMAWCGLTGIVVSALLITPGTAFPGKAALAPVLATGLLLAAGDVRGGVGAAWALGHPGARYIGRISYSLYLWHLPAIVLAAGYYGDKTLGFYLVGAVAPLVLSVVFHHALEEPVRRSDWFIGKPYGYRRSLGEWSEDRKRVVAAVLTVACVVVAVASLSGTDRPAGTAESQPVHVVAFDKPDALGTAIRDSLAATRYRQLVPSLDQLDGAAVRQWKPDGCLNVTPDRVGHCYYGPRNAQHVPFLVGDSYAVSYAPAVLGALQPKGWAVQILTLHNCPFQARPTSKSQHRPRPPYQDCLTHRAQVMDLVKAQRPDMIIATSAYNEVNALVDGYDIGDPRNAALWGSGVSQILAAYRPYTKREVIIGSPPGSNNLQNCVTRTSTPADCNRQVPPVWYEQRTTEEQAAKENGAKYVDVLSWFCLNGDCPAVIGSTPVYWDGVHLTDAYARTLSRLLAPQLL